jgi:hypothetical protein
MKRIILLTISILLLSSLVFGASIPLKATWDSNTETDVAGYNLYRTDGGRIKLNATLMPHPPVLPYLFSITVPDNSQGTATFVMTAVDMVGNESLDSVTVSFPFDLLRPLAPGGFKISK